jgi:hypothetical protein
MMALDNYHARGPRRRKVGQVGLSDFGLSPAEAAEIKVLGQVGSRIAIIPRERIRKSLIDGDQRKR